MHGYLRSFSDSFESSDAFDSFDSTGCGTGSSLPAVARQSSGGSVAMSLFRPFHSKGTTEQVILTRM